VKAQDDSVVVQFVDPMLVVEQEDEDELMRAEEQETVEPMELTDELDKDAPMPAQEPETAEPMELAYGPEMAEQADEMLVDEPASAEQVDQEMAEEEGLAIQGQAEADAQAQLFALRQHEEAQRLAWQQEEQARAQALAWQADLQERERARAEAEEAARQKEQAQLAEGWRIMERARALQAKMALGEQARLAAQAAASSAIAEEAMLDAAPVTHLDAGKPDAEMFESVETDSSASLNSEEMRGLHVPVPGPYIVDPVRHGYLFEAAEGEEVGMATQGAPAAPPQFTAAALAPVGDAAKQHVDQDSTRSPAFPAVPSPIFGQEAHHQTTPAATSPVSQFSFRLDSLAMAPTKLQAEAADASAAPAVEAPQRLAVPANPAERKVLPARGARGSKQARQRVLQELRGSQAPATVVEERERDRIPDELIDSQLSATPAAPEQEDSASDLDELERAVACEEGHQPLARKSQGGQTRAAAASAEAAPAVDAEQPPTASQAAPPANVEEDMEDMEDMEEWLAEVNEEWDAEATAAREAEAAALRETEAAALREAEAAAARGDHKARARAEVRAQLAQQDGQRKAFAATWEQSQPLFPVTETAFEPIAPDVEVRFAPGHREALAEARVALAMAQAAEEARRSAESRVMDQAEEEEEISDEDEEIISAEDEEDGPVPDALHPTAAD
jgi:hypothetical protein